MKLEEKLHAQKLRKAGYSMNEIISETGIRKMYQVKIKETRFLTVHLISMFVILSYSLLSKGGRKKFQN